MQPLKNNPFLGLKPYELADRKKLYGRDKDLFLMKDRIFCARTSLLFAGSGVGKTSFINAKIIPELQSQYVVIYHNQWAIEEPFTAVLKSITAQLPPDEAITTSSSDPSAKEIGSPHDPDSFLFYLSRFNKSTRGETKNASPKRCLIILDQFEEVFQHHARNSYLATFVDELSVLINYEEYSVRVLFSMREEFLGELSIFDNKIPDLFSNYYRLKCPNKDEAIDIIERTCNLIDMPVDEDHLTLLVHDLTRIGKSDHLNRGDRNGKDGSADFDIVAPPYLQIACQRLWDRQFHSSNGNQPADQAPVAPQEESFLSDYQDGGAREMLKSFCDDILKSFSKRERALLAEAFNYLVTKRGAKMAYPLSSLADHMDVDESVLETVLHRLSQPESRILRESNGPDRALWYELYHDMYGPIIDEWRRTYRQEQKADFRRLLKATTAALVFGALVVAVILGVRHWLLNPREYKAILGAAELQKPESFGPAKIAFDKLSGTFGYGDTARELWAEKWKERALLAEKNENREEAMLSWLMAASQSPSDQAMVTQAQLRPYLGNDGYDSLMGTFQLDDDASSPGSRPLFSADGNKLLIATNGMRVLQWDVNPTAPPRLSSVQLLDDPDISATARIGGAAATPGGSPPAPRDQTLIQAATSKFIAGIDSGNFVIWNADNGTVFWKSNPETGPSIQKPQSSTAGYGQAASYDLRLSSISFTPDGQYFATLGREGVARLYNTSPDGVAALGPPIRSVTRLSFSPDNHTLLIFFKNGILEIRDLKSNESRTLKTRSNSISGVAFSPDGSKFLLARQYEQAQIWNTSSGAKVSDLAEVGRPSASFGFWDNETVVVSDVTPAGENKSALAIRFVNSTNGSISGSRVINADNSPTYFLNPNGKSILTTGALGISRLWSLNPPTPNELIDDASGIELYGISTNGEVITTLDRKKEIGKNWSAATRTQIGETFPVKESTAPKDELDVHENIIIVSQLGKYSGITDSTGQFIIREVERNREVLRATKNPDAIGRWVSFSPDDKALAIVGRRDTITLWKQLDSTPRSETLDLQHGDITFAIFFSPDGKYLAALCECGDVSVRVFDVTTAQEIRAFKGDLYLPTVGFSSNGKMISSIAKANEVVVWDFVNDQRVQLQHPTTVTAFALSPDGNRALTSTSEGVLQLWDTATAKPIGTPEKYPTRIRSLRITPDNKAALVFSDNWIHLSSVTDQGLIYRDGQLIRFRGLPRIVDETGMNLRGINRLSLNTLEIDDIHLASQSTPRISTDKARTLFEEWTTKLSLNFDERGQLNRIRSDSAIAPTSASFPKLN